MSESSLSLALDDMKDILAGKNEDYRVDGEFSNFEFAARVAGVSTETVMIVQIAIKLGRLMGQSKAGYNNEGKSDTIQDLAGYANILNAFTNYNSEEF